MKEFLSGYVFHSVTYQYDSPLNITLREKVFEKIENIESEFKELHPTIYDLYKIYLKQQYCAANWLAARSANVQGNMKSAKESLEKMKEALNQTRDDYQLLQIFHEVEEMVFKSLSGERDFLSDRNNWLSKRKDWLKRLQEYIKNENNKYGNCPGSCNIDVYACASEIFGRIGRLDMRFDQDKFSVVENAITNLLMAAYCSSRIGHRKRVAHWLVNASRAYCRLGKNKKAEQLANLAQDILNTAIEPDSHDEYREAVSAEIYLAHGERHLLIEENYNEAIRYFLKALKGSIYLKFARIIAESFYGISRASKQLSNLKIKTAFKTAFGNPKYIQKKSGMDHPIITSVLEDLHKLYQNQDCNSVSDHFKQQPIKIWHDWFVETYPAHNGKHLVEEMMEKGKFLDRII